ncbi:MAG: hypothetical protein KAI02_01310 [Gammaproteobacteria bacterium]|nr:hypothetical protein [Gammaproteobacteria bacterium]
MKTKLNTLLFIILFSTTSISFAEYRNFDDGETTDGEIAVDLLLARPLGLVGTVLGTAVHGIGLIFSIPGGNVSESSEILVKDPFNYTFNRPLGHFENR